MKWIYLTIALFSLSGWSKPVVLVSYFDAFGNAPFNNSERVAKALELGLNHPEASFDIKLCGLQTIFDKSYAQLESCLKNLPDKPIMVLGLGESTCDLKVETIMRNLDKTYGPDNGGNTRNQTLIIPEAPEALGLRYPLPQMYCALKKELRKEIDLSNDAGSFVCNNTAFQMSYYYPELLFGFIHVPSNNCKNLEAKTQTSVKNLELMLKTAVDFLTHESDREILTPHSSNELRLPTKKNELQFLRDKFQDQECMSEYFKRSRGVDEKRVFWIF